MTASDERPGRTVRKAVIPAAGQGTRFLPATKAMPKEMLPVVDTPAIQYIVEEAVRAGLTDVLMITGRNKRSLEDHFDRNVELEVGLEAKGDQAKLARVQESTDLAQVHYVRQGDPKGLGHAVAVAEQHVGDEPFVVLLGDDIVDSRDPLLDTMIKVREEHGGSVVAFMEVPEDQIHLYGCAVAEPTGATDVVKVSGLVEKPKREEAPSNLAIIGRYLLDPAVFDVLRETEPGKGGEIQLTDALQVLAQGDGPGYGVHGVVFRGRRYDTGDKLDYIKAVVRLASEREDIGGELRTWLAEYVKTDVASGAGADS